MIDRRTFIHGAAGVAVLAGGPAAAPARSAADSFGVALDALLVDRHLEGSESFVAKARALGIALYEFSSDVAAVWMRELEPRLRTGPVAIEGYTSAATLFCLGILTRDYGACVVRRGAAPAGVHWLISSSPMLRAPLAPLPSRWSAVHA